MREQIMSDLKKAMKNQDKQILTIIRMIKGAMQLEEINLKRELTDEEVIGVIAKQLKMRKESLLEFEKANRKDLIEQTKIEIDILNSYMPEPLSDEEIQQKIEEVLQETNANSLKDIGKVMKLLNPMLKGRADMSEVSKIVREKLNH